MGFTGAVTQIGKHSACLALTAVLLAKMPRGRQRGCEKARRSPQGCGGTHRPGEGAAQLVGCRPFYWC